MKLPDGPKTPAILQIIRWIFTPMSYMEECYKRYGDIFTLRISNNFEPIVLVSNPQALQQILASDTKEFEAPGELNKVFELSLGKNSVMTISGMRHQRQRQLMMPAFHGERMRTYGDTIRKVTAEIMDSWEIDKPFCVRTSTQTITLRVIMQAVFGLHEGARAQKLEQLLAIMLDSGSSPLSLALRIFPVLRKTLGSLNSLKKFLELKQQIDQLIYAEIKERRQNFDSSKTDVLSLLMAAKDEAGEGMTDEELRDELMTLLIAGHETTATALAWALYWIHKIPTVRQKLLEELDNLGDNLDPNTIFKLPYLNAVCSETLRIYPVGMLTFPRVAKVPVSLAGYDLEAGTVLMGSIYLTHHREDLYPEPKKFNPERFLERQFSPFEFLPFGGGARRCIGSAFALFEMKIALAEIVSRLEMELIDNGEVRPKRRGLVTAPNRSIQMVVKGDRSAKSRTLETVSS